MLFHSLPDRFHLRNLVSPLLWLCGHRVGALGVALTTASFTAMMVFWWEAFNHGSSNPYVGIVGFLILPALFLLGLILIPIGVLLRRRRQRRAGVVEPQKPAFDWQDAQVRRTVYFVGLMTAINIPILLVATYQSTVYVESAQFCGTTCHRVMQPEFTTYQRSPHARVECLDCHTGPGAPGFVQSKISGAYQVFATTFDLFPRPISAPPENLPPARETCEQCHWPEKFSGDKLLVKTQFEEDEENTMTKTVLLMHIGGRHSNGAYVGIHGAHLGDGGRVTYRAADEKRESIPWIGYRNEDGSLTEYVSKEYAEDQGNLSLQEPRTMDCIDCHNRPAHPFLPPEEEIHEAMSSGLIDPILPYARKIAKEILTQGYRDHSDTAGKIAAGWEEYYQTHYPAVFEAHRAKVDRAAATLVDIYQRNVFPSMNINWGTYPDHKGHTNFPGCYRCHDGDHASTDGRTITQDCFACHNLLAMEEPNPSILEELQAGL